MNKIIFLTLILSFRVFANPEISRTLMGEWSRLHNMVESIKPQGEVGEYYNYYELKNATLLWKLTNNSNENEVIRFFKKRADSTIFAITYHKSNDIIPGKTVLRRFIGSEPTAWINHTIDFKTGEYLGSQGILTPRSSSEKALMHDFLISDL